MRFRTSYSAMPDIEAGSRKRRRPDISAVTGQSFEDLESADAALLELIAANDATRDEEGVCALHRRALRLSMIIPGTDPHFENPLFHRLDPILSEEPDPRP